MTTALRIAATFIAATLLGGCAHRAPSPFGETVPFPEGWVGTYRGPLFISNAPPTQEPPMMTLTIEPTDDPASWRWAIHYEGQNIRDYRLLVLPDGQFQIDEGGGLVLEADLVENELHSIFGFPGQLLTVKYTHLGDAIRFDLQTIRQEATNVIELGNSQITTHDLLGAQRAHLQRGN